MNIETYILPAHWAGALINDDNSGLSDEDCAEIVEFFELRQPGHCVGCSDEPYFTGKNDAHTLACHVLEFSFRKD